MAAQNYARSIRIMRAARDMTMKSLAAKVSCDPSHISLIESGKRNPSVQVLHEIANALRCPMFVLEALADNYEATMCAQAIVNVLVMPQPKTRKAN